MGCWGGVCEGVRGGMSGWSWRERGDGNVRGGREGRGGGEGEKVAEEEKRVGR